MSVPPPPPVIVPPPPMAAVPPPPASAVPPPSTSAVPPPPTSAVPPPPTSAVPPPPPPAVSVALPSVSSIAGAAGALSALSPPQPQPITAAGAVPPLPSVPPSIPATAPPPAPASVPAATASTAPAATSSVPPPPTAVPYPGAISDAQWQSLEAEAKRRVANQEGTRYLEVDEVVRDQVCRLFIQSDYDVLKLMANITRGLQHMGRLDVALLRNEDSTAFTITQSVAYGGRGRDETLADVERRRRQVTEAIARVNAANARSQGDFNALVAAAVKAGEAAKATAAAAAPQKSAASPNVTPEEATGVFRATTYERLMASLDKQRREKAKPSGLPPASSPPLTRAPQTNRQRSASAGAGEPRHVYPSSSNGNYLLRRYGGGTYSPESRYEHYRYNGFPKRTGKE